MGRPELKRSGVGQGPEVDQETVKQMGVDIGLIKNDDPKIASAKTASDSPAPATESPVKWVVFRSTDKELVLYDKAGYMDKSHGIATFVPSKGIPFQDYTFRIEDIPENANVIRWLRQHPSNGISFKEVPDLSNAVELPSIPQLKQMALDELKSLCVKNAVTVETNASREAIILALIEKASAPNAA
jgi:hypothetical protein